MFTAAPLNHKQRNFTVSPIGLDALSKVIEIEERAHKAPWRASHLKSSLESHSCLGLFEDDQQLIGYSIVSVYAGEAELLLFVIDKHVQGFGLGAVFLSEVQKQLEGRAERIFLEVRESNLPAIGVYENCGFNQVGLRPNYYPAAFGSKSKKAENALIYAYEYL